MASYETLSALDANFLYWDSESTPLNMGNVCVFEGEPFFDATGRFKLDEVRSVLAARLAAVPRYTMRVQSGVPLLTHPVLVDVPDFDIADHVKLVALPKPGREQELKEVFSRIHEGTMDRSKPLWEIWFVEGLASGRVAMVQKIHHAPFDGQSTVDILESLMDPRDGEIRPEVPARAPQPGPSGIEVLADQLRRQLAAAWDLAVAGPYAPTSPRRVWDNLRGLATVARLGLAGRSVLNAKNTRGRRLDWIHTDIDTVRAIRSLVPGATLNDVMLACISAGIRELLHKNGTDPDTSQLRVFVPVSARSDEQRNALGGNKLTAIMAPYHVDVADDLERLGVIATSMAELKDGGQPHGFSVLLEAIELLQPGVLQAIGPVVTNMRHLMNMTVTNVVGPRQELTLLGAKMLELNPMVPIGNQLALNVAVESYAGNLSVGLSADATLVPDLEPVKHGFTTALLHLRCLADQAND